MGRRHTHDELDKCSRDELVTMVLAMQDQVDALNENIERLIEQARIANSYRFGRHTEKLEAIDGQLSFLMRRISYMTIRSPSPQRMKSCRLKHTGRRQKGRGRPT